MKFSMLTQNEMPMMIGRLKSKPEVEFQYGAVLYSKPQVIITQPWNDISLQNFVPLRIVTFWGHAHYQTGTGSWFVTSTAAILNTLVTS